MCSNPYPSPTRSCQTQVFLNWASPLFVCLLSLMFKFYALIFNTSTNCFGCIEQSCKHKVVHDACLRNFLDCDNISRSPPTLFCLTQHKQTHTDRQTNYHTEKDGHRTDGQIISHSDDKAVSEPLIDTCNLILRWLLFFIQG